MKITFGLAERHKEALSRVATTGQVIPGDWPLMRDLAGAVNQAWDAATVPPPPVPPTQGTVYAARDLGPDDWVYYCDTPAVEWRVQGPGKAEGIRDYQVGGNQWGYFLDNVQRVRATYAGILVQP